MHMGDLLDSSSSDEKGQFNLKKQLRLDSETENKLNKLLNKKKWYFILCKKDYETSFHNIALEDVCAVWQLDVLVGIGFDEGEEERGDQLQINFVLGEVPDPLNVLLPI